MIERRFKSIRLDEQLLVSILDGLHRYEFLRVPECQEIPAGTSVMSVHYDLATRCFDVVLYNKEWPVLFPGMELVRIDLLTADSQLWRRKLTDTHERIE